MFQIEEIGIAMQLESGASTDRASGPGALHASRPFPDRADRRENRNFLIERERFEVEHQFQRWYRDLTRDRIRSVRDRARPPGARRDLHIAQQTRGSALLDEHGILAESIARALVADDHH